MISSEDIEIKLKDSVKLPATVKIHSLFLQQDEAFVLDSTDTTIKRIHSDGKAAPVVNVMESSDNGRTYHNYGRDHVQSQPHAYVREQCVINFYEITNFDVSGCYGMSLHETTSGTQVFKADKARVSGGIPKAAIVGSQVVVGSTTQLQVYNKRGVEVKIVAAESPEFRCEGQVTCRMIKDLCGYDQYSVLLLQDEGVWRADLQTGHSKLVTRITLNAHSVACNKQYIFVGATPQFDQRENTILVFDRGSVKSRSIYRGKDMNGLGVVLAEGSTLKWVERNARGVYLGELTRPGGIQIYAIEGDTLVHHDQNTSTLEYYNIG